MISSDAWRSYLLGTTLLMERLDRDLRENHDLSLPEYEILVRLSESPDRQLRMAELADSVKNSRSRITHTIARMERTSSSSVVSALPTAAASSPSSRTRATR